MGWTLLWYGIERPAISFAEAVDHAKQAGVTLRMPALSSRFRRIMKITQEQQINDRLHVKLWIKRRPIEVVRTGPRLAAPRVAGELMRTVSIKKYPTAPAEVTTTQIGTVVFAAARANHPDESRLLITLTAPNSGTWVEGYVQRLRDYYENPSPIDADRCRWVTRQWLAHHSRTLFAAGIHNNVWALADDIDLSPLATFLSHVDGRLWVVRTDELPQLLVGSQASPEERDRIPRLQQDSVDAVTGGGPDRGQPPAE